MIYNRQNLKRLLLLLLLIVLAVYGYSFTKSSTNPKQEVSIESNTTADKPLILDQKDLEGYYRVYKNPFVLYLRKALNAYLANDSSVGIAMTAIEQDRWENTIGGLDSFDKDYYRSKFVVFVINDAIGGGKDIQIIFQDKPDRAFNAWVYKLAGGEYELRSFYSIEGKEQKIKDLVEVYKSYIFDKEHTL